MTTELPKTLAPTADDVRRSVTPPRRRRIALTATILAAAASAIALYLLTKTRETAPQWATQSVDRGDIVSTATATGNLQPRTTVTVGAEISGLIRSVDVLDSEMVTAGQLLATFDVTDIQSQLDLAKASLSSSTASVRRAVASYEEAVAEQARTQTLVDRGVTARADLDAAKAVTARAKADLDKARADAARAKASVGEVEAMFDKAEIRSPIAGVVLERNVEPGQTVASSLQAPELFVVAEDLRRMDLQIWIDEADVGVVRPEQTATFEVSAWPNREFEAVVRSVDISPTTTDNVVTYMALLSVDNEQGLLRPGMTAAATITTETHADVLRVPNAALRFSPEAAKQDDGPSFSIVPQMRRFGRSSSGSRAETAGGRGRVYVESNGELEAIQVRTGATDGTFTEVTGGALEQGDEVVIGVVQPESTRSTNRTRGSR